MSTYIISGLLKRQRLKVPKGLLTRPTLSALRETLFNVLQAEIEGARVLDLYAGSGAIGLEALSRGADQVLFVEQDAAAIRCIQDNLASCDMQRKGSVTRGAVRDILRRLQDQQKRFDLIIADPPYGNSQGTETESQLLLTTLEELELLQPGGHLFIEEDQNVQLELTTNSSFQEKKSRRVGRCNLYHFTKVFS